MAESKYPAIYIIAYTVFYGSIIIIFFEAFRVSNVPPLFLLIGAILILFDFIQKMEFNPIHSNKNFISLDGVIGVVDSPLMPLHGGRRLRPCCKPSKERFAGGYMRRRLVCG